MSVHVLNFRQCVLIAGLVLLSAGCGDGPELIEPAAPGSPVEALYGPAQVSDMKLDGIKVTLRGAAPSNAQIFVTSRKANVIEVQTRAGLEQVNVNNWEVNWDLPALTSPYSVLAYRLRAELTDGVTAHSPEILTIIREKKGTGNQFDAVMVCRPGAATIVMHSPFEPPTTPSGLRLLSIDYDDDGGVIVSGRSAQPGRIRVYVDGLAIGDTGLGEGGSWTIIAGRTLAGGTYPIEVHLLGAPGEILDRIAIPFTRRLPLKTSQSDENEFWSSANIWQYRYELPGGGIQHTVIYGQGAKILPPVTQVPRAAPIEDLRER